MRDKPTLEEELEMLEDNPEKWKKEHLASLDASMERYKREGDDDMVYRYRAVMELTEEDIWIERRKDIVKKALKLKESETSGGE